MGKGKLTKIAITVILLVLLMFSFSKYLDTQAFKQHDEIFNKALITFGVVKALNGAISLAQGTYVDITPAGVGVSISAGEILDPINDLIERFSWVMLLSATSLGIQRVIMEIGGWWPINMLLMSTIACFIIQLWTPRFQNKELVNITYKVMLLLLVIRFLMPSVSFVNSSIYTHFLGEKYEKSTVLLKSINDEAQEISKDISESSEVADKSSGFLSGVKDKYDAMKESFNLKKKINHLLEKLGEAPNFILNLMTVFLLQAVIIPIVVIWVILRLTGYIFEYNFSCFLDKYFCEKL